MADRSTAHGISRLSYAKRRTCHDLVEPSQPGAKGPEYWSSSPLQSCTFQSPEPSGRARVAGADFALRPPGPALSVETAQNLLDSTMRVCNCPTEGPTYAHTIAVQRSTFGRPRLSVDPVVGGSGADIDAEGDCLVAVPAAMDGLAATDVNGVMGKSHAAVCIVDEITGLGISHGSGELHQGFR